VSFKFSVKLGDGEIYLPSPETQILSDNTTTYFYASSETNGDCQQIPDILLNNTIYCHGPYPEPVWGEPCNEPNCMTAWKLGSCFDNGYTALAGRAANATGQTDMYECNEFYSWNFNQLLPPEESRTQWY
jgi:hypothetical protein